MKTVNSGIIRRIDDLGRVVIPKEMRKLANIKEGDPLEVGIANGCIIFEKYTGEIDEETGLPKPQVNEGSPVQAVKKEPTKLYIDVCERRAFAKIEDIIPIMESNGDITSFEEWLCNNYSASSFFEELNETYKGNFVKAEQELRKEYNDYIIGEAQDLLDNIRCDDYIEVII